MREATFGNKKKLVPLEGRKYAKGGKATKKNRQRQKSFIWKEKNSSRPASGGLSLNKGVIGKRKPSEKKKVITGNL